MGVKNLALYLNIFAKKLNAITRKDIGLAGLLLLVLLGLGLTGLAAGSDFKNPDLVAAAPFTYNHMTGGGAYDDRTVGATNDITEQLEGGQFTCGDIVTYLVKIETEVVVVDPNQTIELDFSFLGDSTGQSGAAHIDIVSVSINYGVVQAGDGPGGTDSGIVDDGGSTATLTAESISGTLFTPGALLLGTVQINDLEAAESVILRIDVRIGCQPNTSPTGNLQAALLAARVVSPVTDTFGSGNQTIPFLQIGNLAGANEPLLLVFKTVTTSSGTCGVDDVELLNINVGDTVKYCYTVTNPGTADLFDLVLTDDNGTPGNPGDDATITLTGLSNLDADPTANDLVAGGTATGERLVQINTSGTTTNTATGTGNNGLQGGQFVALSASDTAAVVAAGTTQHPLDVTLAGAGTGTVTSSVAGIDCGIDCLQLYDENTLVTLTATPDPGSVFVGWSGDPDCSDGIVTLSTAVSCIATFDIAPPVQHPLDVTLAGAGTGSVTSSVAGIDCGIDCLENYDENTLVTLTATPDPGSVFIGWSGDPDCSDGVVTLSTAVSCIATFDIAAAVQHPLDVTLAGSGSGTVTSSVFGIDCGSDCLESYNENTVVTLTATPDPGSIFVGWSGDPDCSDGVVTLSVAVSCVATFELDQQVGGDPPVWGDIMVFPTPEAAHGFDLNNDGDLDDTILRYKNISNGQITNTGISVSDRHRDTDIYGDQIVFVYRGNTLLDRISSLFNPGGRIGVYNIKTGKMQLLSISGSRPSIYKNIISFTSGLVSYYDLDAERLVRTAIFGKNQVVWGDLIAYESLPQEGERPEIFLYNIKTGAVIATGAVGGEPAIHAGRVAFETSEQVFGGDLDGDGAVSQTVIRYFDIAGRKIFNTGVAGEDPAIYNNHIVFSQGKSVLYYNTATTECYSTGLLGTEPDIYGETITYYVWEQWQVRDMNLDGDRRDPIVGTHTISASDPVVHRTASATTPSERIESAGFTQLKLSATALAIRFEAMGRNIESAKLEIFDLTGRLIYSSQFETGSKLSWTLKRADGTRVANGVYIYRVTVRDAAGNILGTQMKKLVVLK